MKEGYRLKILPQQTPRLEYRAGAEGGSVGGGGITQGLQNRLPNVPGQPKICVGQLKSLDQCPDGQPHFCVLIVLNFV